MRVEQGMSYSAIRDALGVPKSTLSYWLHEHPLSEERILELRRAGWKKGEASRERYRNTMRAKRAAKDKERYKEWMSYFGELSERDLMVAGLLLYIGEGTKRKAAQLSLANTDPQAIRLFMTWMESCFGVSREEFRIQLHLYASMDLEVERKFWQNALKVKKQQFYKGTVRNATKHSFSYSASHGHGTCSVYVYGAERERNVKMAMQAFLDLQDKRD